jgi:hypothetical protein
MTDLGEREAKGSCSEILRDFYTKATPNARLRSPVENPRGRHACATCLVFVSMPVIVSLPHPLLYLHLIHISF